jgi:antitoxin component YwqK of YwqJK toxin-antitoxin module
MKISFLTILMLFSILSSCKQEVEEKVKVETKEDLIQVENGIFTEYYPGRKLIKFQGPQDEKGERHGKWSFKNEAGIEVSVTMYDHGKKHGHSIVKYPNGAIYYVGEYHQDEKIGLWTTYNVNGEIIEEKDFGSVK